MKKTQTKVPGKKHRMSNISILHYFKLVFRSALLLLGIVLYILSRINETWFVTKFNFRANDIVDLFKSYNNPLCVFLVFIWFFEIFEMILRFFPSRFESMGCQKQFKRNYIPREGAAPAKYKESMKGVVLTGVLWVLLIGTFGVLHFVFPNYFDQGILLLISLAFSVCDMICILFFCPFHTWFMKNKCCGSCRIYNWDYFMMFSPLIFIPTWYTWTLVAFSVALLIRWEFTALLHPERFLERTNEALTCANCPEKLCHHKKQLQHYLKQYRALAKTVVKETVATIKECNDFDADAVSLETPIDETTPTTEAPVETPVKASTEEPVSVGGSDET